MKNIILSLVLTVSANAALRNIPAVPVAVTPDTNASSWLPGSQVSGQVSVSNLAASVSGTTVSLSWTPSLNAITQTVYYKTATGSWTALSGSTDISYTVTSASATLAAESYSFEIVTKDSNGRTWGDNIATATVASTSTSSTTTSTSTATTSTTSTTTTTTTVEHTVTTDDGLTTTATSDLAGSTTSTESNGDVVTTTPTLTNSEGSYVDTTVTTHKEGDSTIEVKVTDSEGVSSTIISFSEIAGSTTKVSSDGSVLTTVTKDSSTLSTQIGTDGFVKHIVDVLPNTSKEKITEAISKVLGSTLTIKKDGSIETKTPEIPRTNGTIVAAKAVSTTNGATLSTVTAKKQDGTTTVNTIESQNAGTKITIGTEGEVIANVTVETDDGTGAKKEVVSKAISTDKETLHVFDKKGTLATIADIEKEFEKLDSLTTIVKSQIPGTKVVQKTMSTTDGLETTIENIPLNQNVAVNVKKASVTVKTGSSGDTSINLGREVVDANGQTRVEPSIVKVPTGAKIAVDTQGIKIKNRLSTQQTFSFSTKTRAVSSATLTPIDKDPNIETTITLEGTYKIRSLSGRSSLKLGTQEFEIGVDQIVNVDAYGTFISKEKVVNLNTGWNLVGTPVNMILKDPKEAFNALSVVKLKSFCQTDPDSAEFWNSCMTSNISEILPGEALFVYSENTQTVNLSTSDANEMSYYSLYPANSSIDLSNAITVSGTNFYTNGYIFVEANIGTLNADVLWDFGDGIKSSQNRGIYYYKSAGNYTITCTITTNDTTFTKSYPISVIEPTPEQREQLLVENKLARNNFQTRALVQPKTTAMRSLTFDATAKTISEKFGSSGIYTYDSASSQYKFYSSEDDTTVIKSGTGFIASIDASKEYLELSQGWNLIYLSSYANSTNQTLKDLGIDYSDIFQYDALNQKWRDNATNIPLSEGFWLNANSAATVAIKPNSVELSTSTTFTAGKWYLLGSSIDSMSDNYISNEGDMLYLYRNNQWTLADKSNNRFIPSNSGFWVKKN